MPPRVPEPLTLRHANRNLALEDAKGGTVVFVPAVRPDAERWARLFQHAEPLEYWARTQVECYPGHSVWGLKPVLALIDPPPPITPETALKELIKRLEKVSMHPGSGDEAIRAVYDAVDWGKKALERKST